jgi:rhodanese-related sulfurtransferase
VPVGPVVKHAATLGVPKDAEIIVYCLGPSCPQSGDAARKLTTLGYTNVLAYEGGLEEWKASGREVARVSDQKVA